MKQFLPRWLSACFLALLMAASPPVHGQDRKVPPTVLVLPNDSVGQLVSLVREKAKSLEGSSGMRLGFQAFTTAHGLAAESIRYSDYVIVRLLFEATRDAGFWNLHRAITDQPPNSDRIWQQWKGVTKAVNLRIGNILKCNLKVSQDSTECRWLRQFPKDDNGQCDSAASA